MNRTGGNRLAARGPAQRRGSFLVAVVAILSLLAVITIVYVTVGRTDAQLSSAVQRKSERGQPELIVRDWIAGIIAADATEVFDPNEFDVVDLEQPLVRENTDYPSTPWSVQFFNPDTGANENRPVTVGEPGTAWFTPTGEVVIDLGGGDEYVVGTGSDPWLASTEPTWLANDPAIGEWNDVNAAEYPLRRVDLANISNLAPDGAFVNLFNLRSDQAGFNASPWEMRGFGAPDPELRLSLYNPDNQVDGPTDRGIQPDYLAGPLAETSDDPATRPYYWTARQIGAHRPADDAHFATNEAGFSGYQWADTDGDGAYDARWFELVLDRDPRDNAWEEILSRQGDVRYFVAATVRDLSSMVNVNTATDDTPTPLVDSAASVADYAGARPSHVDLRRLLTLSDFYRDDVFQDPMFLVGYEQLQSTNVDYSGYSPDTAFEVGDRAYDALRLAIDNGVVPRVLLQGGSFQNPGYDGLVNAAGSAAGVDREFQLTFPVTGLDRATHYDTIGSISPLAFASYASGTQYNASSLFGLDSLAELLTFRRLNDPTSTSRLELVLQGRGDFVAANPEAAYGPLRAYQRGLQDLFFDAGAGDAAGRSNQFLAHSLVDVRGRLTTLSGHRPIRSADFLLPSDPAYWDGSRRIESALSLSAARDLPRVLNRALLTDAGALFSLYADSLLPWSDYTDPMGTPVAWTTPEYNTLAYSYDHERALRIAAHLAVNMVDIAEDGASDPAEVHEPTRRSVIVDASYRGDLASADGRVAFPHDLLDLGDARLAADPADLSDGTAGYGRAVNVFGIEAQPFISAVTTMSIYCDVTNNVAGSSSEAPTGNIDPGTMLEERTPNVNADVDVANSDFQFEVLAIELTNPFDEPIELAPAGAVDDDAYAYYLEFGELLFRVASHEVDTAGAMGSAPARDETAALTLGPNETRVFYCLSREPSFLVARLITNSDSLVTSTGQLDVWLDNQFGDDAVFIWPMVDAFSGDPVDPTSDLPASGVIDLLGAADPDSLEQVRLWRALRDADVTGSISENAANARLNDQLLDRFRTPGTNLLELDPTVLADVRQAGGTQDITGASDGVDEGSTQTGDQEGLVFVQWATVNRSGDTQSSLFDGGADDANGILPAWAMEPVDPSFDHALETEPSPQPDPADAFDEADRAGDNLADWWLATSMMGAGSIVPPLEDEPWDRAVEDLGDLDASGERVELRLTAGTASTVSAQRVADLLLPIGIGPSHDPGPDLTDASDDRWLTLAEAITIAHGRTDGLGGVVSVGVDPFYGSFDAVDADDGNLDGVDGLDLLFKGQLLVDAFVPFYNGDVEDPPEYDPTSGGSNDIAWGLRITPAARLIQNATAFDRQQGSLSRPVFGTVNANTAPLEVLRTLPMLSPPVGVDNVSGSGDPAWWWEREAQMAGGSAPHGETSDIASTIVGYRDLIQLATRSPTGLGAQTVNYRNGNTGAPPGYNAADSARFFGLGFLGTTELPGIRSMGELLLVRDLNNPTMSDAHWTDRLIVTADDVLEPGLASTLYDTDGSGTINDGDLGDGYPDPGGFLDYDQQLIIPNSLLNTVSVGSDYYAVWFLLHGYTEADTEVDPSVPLVPTIARRFLMVVDRSQVIDRGDEPEIVLFREVPVSLR